MERRSDKEAPHTTFLCGYLHWMELWREIRESLNVMEYWNDPNAVILDSHGREIATNRWMLVVQPPLTAWSTSTR